MCGRTILADHIRNAVYSRHFLHSIWIHRWPALKEAYQKHWNVILYNPSPGKSVTPYNFLSVSNLDLFCLKIFYYYTNNKAVYGICLKCFSHVHVILVKLNLKPRRILRKPAALYEVI